MIKKETIWGKIKWKGFMWKIRSILWLSDVSKRLLISNHCKKGFHYFENGSRSLTTYKNSKSRTWKSNLFQCKFCGLIRFSTKKDRRNYNLIEGRSDRNMRLFVKDVMNKGRKTKIRQNGKKKFITNKI